MPRAATAPALTLADRLTAESDRFFSALYVQQPGVDYQTERVQRGEMALSALSFLLGALESAIGPGNLTLTKARLAEIVERALRHATGPTQAPVEAAGPAVDSELVFGV